MFRYMNYFIFLTTISLIKCELFQFPFGFESENKLQQAESSGGSPRIIGGETSPDHYPYQISLQLKRDGEAQGGFLSFLQGPRKECFLNENYIVTAAHCIEAFNISQMSVLAGTKDLRKESEGVRSLIDDCVIHPDYVELNTSDVSVCKLQTSLPLGDNIAPIELSKEYVGGGENCTLTGWGYTIPIREISTLPNELQRAELQTITNTECNQRGYNVGTKEICTFSRVLKGACGGDSGGPLQCNDNLVGIVSYGARICAIGLPDVFTRVSEFTEWIEQNSSGLPIPSLAKVRNLNMFSYLNYFIFLTTISLKKCELFQFPFGFESENTLQQAESSGGSPRIIGELSKEYIGGGEKCTLTGWGYTIPIRKVPTLPYELHRLKTQTITNTECNQRGQNVGNKEVCAFAGISEGACGGDSGGPLQCNGNLVGIASSGTRICATGLPDVFARVSEFTVVIAEMLLQFVECFILFMFATCSKLDDHKIVGGEESPIIYYYQISLQRVSTRWGREQYNHFCGGSILSEYYIITAAHCVQGQDVSSISVFAGTSDLEDTQNGIRRSITSCLIHPDYRKLNTSDIALCQVKVPFVFGPTVGKINIDNDYVNGGINCTLTGWGSIYIFRWLPIPFYSMLAYPDELHRVILTTISNENCIERGLIVDETQICTFTKFGQGACAGDSGGPLVYNGILVGIVSYGTAICSIGAPDVFTRASHFYDWIISNTDLSSAATTSNQQVQSILTAIPDIFQ
ncbi:CLUMA_CG015168, isoform A [Clunio marinus]|uniref:CLUMA_CG015168, isoform A n=1 Tax=Clunio marinus TaxID=568069 RepID=A0A1J1IQJ5_9DIPT|nr:CLUMA_CG015168, isoform A [Clunio marinus]